LLARLSVYVEDNSLGVVTGEQGGYRLDPAHPLETELAPDIAFVQTDRLPSPTSPDYYKRAPQLAPDLAVEGQFIVRYGDIEHAQPAQVEEQGSQTHRNLLCRH